MGWMDLGTATRTSPEPLRRAHLLVQAGKGKEIRRG